MLALVLAGCGPRAPAPATGTIERHRYEVSAPATEMVVAMPVREGQKVHRGDLLAELDPASLAANRAAIAAQLAQLRHRLDELEHGPRGGEIAEARAQLAAAQAQRDQTEREYQRQAELLKRGLVAQAQVDQQRQLRDSSAAAAQGAQAALGLLEEGTRAEQLAQARAAVQAAQAQLAQQDVLLSRLRLLAPVDGTIEALPYRAGERPPAGAPVVIMLADGMPYARVYFPEPERARLRAGQSLLVHVDGFAAPFRGTLRFISAEASFTPYYSLTQRDRSRLAYVAEIDLPGPAAADLPAGVPVEVRAGEAQ